MLGGRGGRKGEASGAPALERVIVIGSGPPAGAPRGMAYDARRTRAPATSDADLDARERQVGPDEVINMQYTSGTTGFPKWVMLTSRNIVDNGYWLGRGLAYTPVDRLCLCVPPFHCFGCVIGVLVAYTHGSTRCVVASFDARQV